MSGQSLKHASFIAGEIDPALHARTDLNFYPSALRTCRNFIVRPGGGVVNRPGTKLVREVKDSADATRLIPFIYSEDDSYVLEFGDLYMRVHKNGATVMENQETGSTHDGASDAATLSDSGAAFTPDEYIGGIVYNLLDGSQGVITDNDGTTVTAVLQGGKENRWDSGDTYEIDMPYEIVTPYLTADVGRLKFAQLWDEITLVHPDYYPRVVTRVADDDWSIALLSVVRTVQKPTDVRTDVTHDYPTEESTPDVYRAKTWSWVVCSVASDGEVSLPSTVYTDAAAVLYPDKETYKIDWDAPTSGPAPQKYLIYRGRHGRYGYVGSSTTTSFEDEGYVPDYTDSPPEETDPFDYTVPIGDVTETVSFSGDTATKVTDPEAYNDYYTYKWKVINGSGEDITVKLESRDSGLGAWTDHGNHVCDTEGTVWYGVSQFIDEHDVDNGAEFRISIVSQTGTPTLERQEVIWYTANPTPSSDNFPACVTFFEQRQVFGNFSYDPAQLVASKTGEYKNFDRSIPSLADDALDFRLASVRLNEIRAVAPLDKLLIFTAAAEWAMQGVSGGALAPNSVDAKPRSFHGSSWLDPLIVGTSALFVPDRAATVREFIQGQSITEAAFATRDLGVMAKHLFEGHEIVDWDYAEDPYGVVWAVRDDGRLVAMTYVKEHGVFGWHRHDTGNKALAADVDPRDSFESICVVPEGGEHAIYVVVKRYINSSYVRFVERFATRQVGDIEDAIFMDCTVTYDGLDDSGENVTINEYLGGGYDAGAEVEVDVSGAQWEPTMVGKQVVVYKGSDTARVNIATYVDTGQLRGTVVTAIPAALQGIAGTSFARGLNTFNAGLEHLEGEDVAVLVDGNTHDECTVTAGAITLDTDIYGVDVQVGIPYYSDLETLQIHIAGSPGTFRDKSKIINKVSVEVEESRSLYAGQELASLTAWEQRDTDLGYQTAINPMSKLIEVVVEGTWRRTGGCVVRMIDPLPLQILSVIPKVDVGDD
jgi:hypothetical protein